MKFKVKLALAAVVAILIALAAAPWTVSEKAQIAAVKSQIRTVSGMRLIAHGRSVFAVLPRPHIRIYNARLEESDGALRVSASNLRVDLGLAGLLTGRLTLARTVLTDAVFTIDMNKIGPLSWTARKVRPNDRAIGELRIENGKLKLRKVGASAAALVADAINARLDWSRVDSPLSLIGHCLLPSLGGDRPPTQFALWAAQPGKLAHGEESPITLRADSDAFQLNLNGGFAFVPRLHFHGKIGGAAASLRFAAKWLGLTLPLPGRYGQTTLTGEASLDPEVLSFPKLNLSIDGNMLDGAASIRLDGERPMITATLAGASVDFAPLIDGLPAPSFSGQWSHQIFPPSNLAAADLDLRLSATHARIGDFQADNVALSALLKNGRLDLSLADAKAYSGQIHAHAIIADSDKGLDVRGSAVVDKLDVAAFLWDAFKRQTLTGSGRVNLSFETTGDSYYRLASHLDARGDFAVKSGEVYGVDLDLAFRRMERRPLTAGVELRSGRTPFDLLSGKFNIVQGEADIEEGVARSPSMTAYFSGEAAIADRLIDLHAAADRVPQSGDKKPLQLGFTISGGWDDASLIPDVLSLIHRSDAAAPLLPKPAPANQDVPASPSPSR